MAQSRPQSLENHARIDPFYHYVLTVLLLITLTLVLALVFRRHDLLSFAMLSGTFALLVMAAKVRMYPLKVQDRVIRLEERLRLMTILPVLLHHRIAELSESQLIALRFASDKQLMALTARVLEEKLDSKQIKAAITEWRPDHYRV
jgi:cytochrome bd-type quinol oxidase subunit 2